MKWRKRTRTKTSHANENGFFFLFISILRTTNTHTHLGYGEKVFSQASAKRMVCRHSFHMNWKHVNHIDAEFNAWMMANKWKNNEESFASPKGVCGKIMKMHHKNEMQVTPRVSFDDGREIKKNESRTNSRTKS